jgi:hypothetical protein
VGLERVLLVSRRARERLLGLAVALAGGLMLIGCPDNQAACIAYYEALSSARTQCGIQPTDPDDPLLAQEVVCPANLNHGGDCVDHYLALRDSVYCDTTNTTVKFQQVEGTPAPGRTNGCF